MDEWLAARRIPRTDGALVLLDVPDIRQDSEFDCGAAAVDAVCRYHRIRKTNVKDLTNAVQGLGPDTARAILTGLGLIVLAGPMQVEDLQHLTRTNRPVLCPVNLYGGHWVVVRGVERGGVYFQCPTQGRLRLSMSKWLDEWVSYSETGHMFHQWGIATSR